MIIGIDGNEANESERVGVHQYAFEILWALYKLQDIKNSYIIYLKSPPSYDFPPETPLWTYKVIPGGRFWVLSRLMPRVLFTEKLDVFFSPGHYLPAFTGCPKVMTIHDLGYLKFSEQFTKYDFWQLKYWSAISIFISKYIICPSKYTAKDIVRHYPFASNKIKVVYHGYNKALFNKNIDNNFVRQSLQKYRITKNYILFLSTLKPSKNIEGLLDAFKEIRKEYDYKLVIAGKKGWLYETIFRKVKNLGFEKDVIFTDYVPEVDKPALIKGAKIFVLPSFWEGFGMDVLNALACGTPVVLSNVASLPEVGGEAGIYIDPYDIKDIIRGMKKVLKMNSKEYNKLAERGFSQVQKFSWQKTAKKTLEVLTKAVK